MSPSDGQRFVGRGGAKLAAALDAFGIDPTGMVCADLGCNVGGFTDCLLQAGAAKVYAVDTGYGILAWKLRRDDRVVVMERTNALHCDVPEPVDLAAVDVSWTPQRLIVPAARRWLKPAGEIISLLKPHYELAKIQRQKPRRTLTEAQTDEVRRRVCDELDSSGLTVRRSVASPLRGKGGNREFLLLIRPAGPERP